ncbi:hypothetical protein SteCoe_25133 [Stentor coeruleus]|uniref:Uncharacterized protein n=1 Tax=Stentor coeruleus TaxID=5963 RepID=A0A1R2BFV3_9CILI|nr:hypothetical protein SteCoe_25133 [Stentor coeruleus]
MKKDKGLKLKLLPKEGEGCYLVPLREEDIKSDKYAHLKKLIGAEYFRDGLKKIEPTEDVQIEEFDEEDAVDIDIDPKNINDEEFEVIKALYDDKEYEELDDDFVVQANLDKVLEEYKDDPENIVTKVSQNEFESAMDEFISEHQQMFTKEPKLNLDFERLPFEQDHVLQAAIAKEPSPYHTPEPSDSSDESEDDVVSHASHFTNTDNRPEIVSIRTGESRKKIGKDKKKKDEDEKNDEDKKESGKRKRNETKEEKKARKDKIKMEKKEAREKKKKLKDLYKVEKNKIDERDTGNYDIRSGTSVIKLT